MPSLTRPAASAGSRRPTSADAMAMGPRRYTGTLRKFSPDHGFGWIKVNAPLPEVYIHIAAFSEFVGVHMLGPGVKVEFYIERHARGLRAVRANII